LILLSIYSSTHSFKKKKCRVVIDLLRFHFQVEHIVREENMMAAQEIIELFCELITVRLPIIESQRF